MALAAAEPVRALIAYDEAANYTSGWTNGANEGYGFGPWLFSFAQQPDTNTPPAYFAGAFLGDPAAAGISGMGTNAFALYANPSSEDPSTRPSAFVFRPFAQALSVGQTFRFKWGLHWDSGAGFKGFALYSGGSAGDSLLNVEQNGFPGDIFVGTPEGGPYANAGIGFGNFPMLWEMTLETETSLHVTSTGRDGSSSVTYSTNFAVASRPDGIGFWANNMDTGNERQPYFNNLQIVPEPSTSALFFTSLAGWLLWRVRSKGCRWNSPVQIARRTSE